MRLFEKDTFFKTDEFLAKGIELLNAKYGKENWANINLITEWPVILKKVCIALDKESYWDYWYKLPYDESDILDQEIWDALLDFTKK